MPEPYIHVVFMIAAVVAAVAAGLDLKTGEIPNWLTYPAMIVAPFVHIARVSVGTKGVSDDAIMEGAFSLGGAVVCSLVPLVLYRRGAIGGGDIKLLAAVGALLQTSMGVEAQMYTFFAATLVAPAKLAYEGKLMTTLKNTFALGANVFLPKAKQKSVDEAVFSWFRLGPAVLFGVLFTAYMHW